MMLKLPSKIYAPERGMDEQGLKQFRREYAVVLNLNHSNLLTARGTSISGRSAVPGYAVD